MPLRHSRPAHPRSTLSRTRSSNGSPAAAVSSTSPSASRVSTPRSAIFTTRPSTPSSATTRFEPPPSTRSGTRRARARRVPLRVLGGGSNLVVADEGVDGLVVRIALRGVTTREADGAVELTAAAGEPLDDLVRESVERGWAGLECLSGIPGLVGATPIQNVGAYGQEVSDTVTAVRALDTRDRRFVTLSNPE